MSPSIRWKALGVGALVLLFGFLTAANFVPKAQRVESALWPDDGLRLGLDLRGGIHWVVGVELDDAVERARGAGLTFVLLQCTSVYPTPPARTGLNVIGEFRERYGCPVGLSDHSGTPYAALAAAALGIAAP